MFVFPSSLLFLPVRHCLGGWSKINLKFYDVINCLNKNLTAPFAWYLGKVKRYEIETLSFDRVLNKEHFYGKIMQKILVLESSRPLFTLVNISKQPLHARNYFKNKIFWRMIIKKALKKVNFIFSSEPSPF